MSSQRQGEAGNIKPSALTLQMQTILLLTELFKTDTKAPPGPKHHPCQLQLAAMCKGLASLHTCCLERTKEMKARLGNILQKPNWTFSCFKIGKNKPSLEECLCWKESFEKLLSSKCKEMLIFVLLFWQPSKQMFSVCSCYAILTNIFVSADGLCAFTAFLVSEFSEENIAFYFACEDYRQTKCPAKLRAKAQKIFDEFFGSDAPREINIDHETRDITKANLQTPTPSCFDLAQHRIYMLMAKDCYPRFLRSPAYRDLVCQAKPTTKSSKHSQPDKKV
uniref:Regulator of G protein signaling 16 n=1 Tax=Oryzias sinensis TaxID=183150 RepID=A0A8C7X777_9TELE